ncbi:putative membrane spanning protein [Borrelia duttonii CR2A]|uniref:Putative membrane spanning protein n=1 Tax=Borrelia duttonii CR2A TaxID=1432657 RepID=W6TH54_9SPIR|nr:putative membrane spanning protein [Borrelia duttonii CR2A]ETZ19019.1 putative membrane spanning protein [Borrelia duttonii CR2A]
MCFLLGDVYGWKGVYSSTCSKPYSCYYLAKYSFNGCRFNTIFETSKEMKVDKIFVNNILLTFLFMNFLFVILIVLFDLLTNLLNYLEHNLSINDIIYIYYLYLPKCFSDGVALSFLFAVSNLLGNLSMRNEIIGLFSCGISIARILRSIIMLSVFVSVILFFLIII